MSLLRQGTYSIVARDPESGQLGVAVQSHWFSVGPIVPWAIPGVGAVATQANVEIAYGPRALELLEAGHSPQDALDQLTGEDPGARSRQVAVIDAAGNVAAHTGELCMAYAGHITADGVSCQANIMTSDRVWPAMLEAYHSARGPLAERLMQALEAAEATGGDARGKQSAAILVVPAEGKRWARKVELRVEDHPDPLPELRRLLSLHDAYALASRADTLVGEGRHAEAAELYGQASDLAPTNHELMFWAGLGIAQTGNVRAGAERVRVAIEMHPGWH
jgi:uncharacterized Ntn-hydrolase superfamily protein